jgi:alkylhydroperoxidase family enzyme
VRAPPKGVVDHGVAAVATRARDASADDDDDDEALAIGNTRADLPPFARRTAVALTREIARTPCTLCIIPDVTETRSARCDLLRARSRVRGTEQHKEATLSAPAHETRGVLSEFSVIFSQPWMHTYRGFS